MERRRIVVVGAGLAGLASALAAARAGAAVRVHDAHPRTPVPPAHEDVVPNMLRDLVALGVGDECVRSGFPYRRTTTLGLRGNPLFSIDSAHLAGSRYPAALGITRARLHALLARAAASAGAELVFNAVVAEVDPGGHRAAQVRFTSGETEQAELVVLACGAASALGRHVFGAGTPVPIGSDWFYLLVRTLAGLDEAIHAASSQGDAAHIVPVGDSRAGVRLICGDGHRDLDAHSARAVLRNFSGIAGALAAQVAHDTQVVRRPAETYLLPEWVRDRVVAVGDCAHALPPHLGQSAALGVEDAIVLGELIAAGDEIDDVLERFVRRRSPRVKEIVSIVVQAACWDAMPSADTDLPSLARRLEEMVREPA